MSTARTAARKAKAGPAKSATAVRRKAEVVRQAEARREMMELSDRIDRDLARLMADTDRLVAQVMRK